MKKEPLDELFSRFDRQHDLFNEQRRRTFDAIIERQLERYDKALNRKIDRLIRPLSIRRLGEDE
jgi:hypothetical protein